MAEQEKVGWEQTKAIWRDKHTRFIYRVMGGAILVGVGVVIGWTIFAEKQVDYALSLFTNVLSIFVTVFVIDLLAQRREERKADQELKELLILQMKHGDNALAIQAVERIRLKGWHKDGSLRKQHFESAELRGANLEDFDLREAGFTGAHLEYAKLHKADLYKCEMGSTYLQNANLMNVKMSEVILTCADLQNAILFCADLRGARIEDANLQGTDLTESNLEGIVGLETTITDENTRMPDRYDSFPRKNDFIRFAAPTHPNFWRSDNPRSPAYRDKKEN